MTLILFFMLAFHMGLRWPWYVAAVFIWVMRNLIIWAAGQATYHLRFRPAIDTFNRKVSTPSGTELEQVKK